MGDVNGRDSAPFIATWLVHDFGVGWVGVYLSIAGVLTFVALLAARETRGVDLAQV